MHLAGLQKRKVKGKDFPARLLERFVKRTGWHALAVKNRQAKKRPAGGTSLRGSGSGVIFKRNN
jgi:hypothetical protein